MCPTRVEVDTVGEILLREVSPEDKWRFREGVRQLSQRSRYLRFHNPLFKLTDTDIEYLVDVDQVDHVAIGALDCTRPEQPGIAVARWIRNPEAIDRAEIAITVVDAWQGKGIGTLLLAGLSLYAAGDGIGRFEFYLHKHRSALIAYYLNLEATILDCHEGVLEMQMPVPRDSSALPDSRSGRYLGQALELLGPSFC